MLWNPHSLQLQKSGEEAVDADAAWPDIPLVVDDDASAVAAFTGEAVVQAGSVFNEVVRRGRGRVMDDSMRSWGSSHTQNIGG